MDLIHPQMNKQLFIHHNYSVGVQLFSECNQRELRLPVELLAAAGAWLSWDPDFCLQGGNHLLSNPHKHAGGLLRGRDQSHMQVAPPIP